MSLVRLSRAGSCGDRSRFRAQWLHLEPLEDRLPPGETWCLLGWSWWGLDLASRGTSAGECTNSWVGLSCARARVDVSISWPLPLEEEASVSVPAPARHAFQRDPVEQPGRSPSTPTSGAVGTEQDSLQGSAAAFSEVGTTDFPAQIREPGARGLSQGSRSDRGGLGLYAFEHATPTGAGAASATAPAWPSSVVTIIPRQSLSVATNLPAPGLGQWTDLASGLTSLVRPRAPGSPPPGGSSLALIGYSLGDPVVDANSFGDTWGPAWALDGQVYTASDDSSGFDNAFSPNGYDIVANRLTGDPNAGTLHGVTLAGLTAYGPWAEGCVYNDGCDNWKATNMTSVNGVLYLGVSITSYVDQLSLQPQRDANIIKSDNSDGQGLGHTWGPAHAYLNDPTTMWPDTPAFSAPYFVDYGQDPGLAGNPTWPDGADQYTYAVSTEAAVRNSSNLYLGRIRRDQIGNLRAQDWSFVTRFDAQGNPVWGPVDAATPVLGVLHGDNTAGRLGWTTAEWVAPIQKYILTEWYYPNPRAECPGDPGNSCQSTSRWIMYQADHVWGPWQQFGPDFTWAPGNPSSLTEGDYFPVVPTRFMDTEVDTSVYPYQLHMWVLTTGNYWNADFYHLTAVPLTLELIPTPTKEISASISTSSGEALARGFAVAP